MNGLIRRAEDLARARQQNALKSLATEVRRQVPGARVEIAQDNVVISAVRLMQRWLADPTLRLALGALP
jgi:hypothetical protein